MKSKLIIITITIFCALMSFGQGEKSFLRTKDEISMKVRKYFAPSLDLPFVNEFYAKDLTVFINDLKIEGKENYLKRLQMIHDDFFKDIKMENLHVHTNYFSPEALTGDGKTMGEVNSEKQTIWSNAWGTFTGIGRVSGKKVSFRMHRDFRTKNGKVIEMLAYYDPAQMNAEIEAFKKVRLK